MSLWVLFLSASTAVAATVFVIVAVLWLRKLRETVQAALLESASQQVRSAQRLGESTDQLHKQQRVLAQQLQALAHASARLRLDLTTIASRVEHAQQDMPPEDADRTVH